MNTEREFFLSKENSTYLEQLVSQIGMQFDISQGDALYNRLARRLRFLKLLNFHAYCELLEKDAVEKEKFINIVTNITTSFFREKHHFKYLARSILPELLARNHKIRIWSAGCATGEEAYSIAVVVKEVVKDLENYDIKILATDINSEALSTAEAGIYDFESIKNLQLYQQKFWFYKIENSHPLKCGAEDCLKELITFRQLNLLGFWPLRGPFDVIFCRNVFIYFKPEASMFVLSRFNKLLKIGGLLILGHADGIQQLRSRYICVEKSVYKKILD